LLSRSVSAQSNSANAVFETALARSPANEVDQLVFAQLDRLTITPANLCSDAVFVRRVYLDVMAPTNGPRGQRVHSGPGRRSEGVD
jgi:hypothetical protein